MKNKKLKEMVLYVADKSKDDPYFGATKLNKILFAADFYAYGIWGKSITGAKYIHRGKGPAPFEIPIVLDKLIAESRAKVEDVNFHGYFQKRVVPLCGSDTSSFSEEELKFVDSIIDQLRKYNATELSEWTHRLIPWLLTEQDEVIPYFTIFVLRHVPVNKSGILWAEKELYRLEKETAHVA